MPDRNPHTVAFALHRLNVHVKYARAPHIRRDSYYRLKTAVLATFQREGFIVGLEPVSTYYLLTVQIGADVYRWHLPSQAIPWPVRVQHPPALVQTAPHINPELSPDQIYLLLKYLRGYVNSHAQHLRQASL